MNRKAWFALTGLAAVMMLAGCNTIRLAEERDALWNQNQQLQQELDAKRAALEMAEAERAELLVQIGRLQAGGGVAAPIGDVGAFEQIPGVEAVARPGAISVRVPGDILFASGRVTLKESAKKTLDEIAAVIQREYQLNTIRVEGYTDTDPIKKSKWKDNLQLSLERAAAVLRYLEKKGIDPKRMYAAGYGQWRPQATKAKSRRVEIVVVLTE